MKINDGNSSASNDEDAVRCLLERALEACDDDDTYWSLVQELHRMGTPRALRCISELVDSEDPSQRRLAADVLGQFGLPKYALRNECRALLQSLLAHESESAVIQSIGAAFMHTGGCSDIERLSSFADAKDSDARLGVVLGLLDVEDPAAVDVLIRLSEDGCVDVRDWATFGLATCEDMMNPHIGEALFLRLKDTDYDTRCEAILGLARRKDPRVVNTIKEELSKPSVGRLVIEAAKEMASPELFVPLRELQKKWEEVPCDGDEDRALLDVLQEAIDVCARRAGEDDR